MDPILDIEIASVQEGMARMRQIHARGVRLDYVTSRLPNGRVRMVGTVVNCRNCPPGTEMKPTFERELVSVEERDAVVAELSALGVRLDYTPTLLPDGRVRLSGTPKGDD